MSRREVYLHGSDPDEQDRLALMNELLNDACLQQLELRGADRVLDLGAGTGIFAAVIADSLPRGHVIAIERDARQFDALRQRANDRLVTRQGDVYDPPLAAEEWGAFDVVHARFLLEHLADPVRAVGIMARAVRPGGRIVLVDDDHSLMRFDPDPGPIEQLWRDYYEVYGQLGNDPLIGRRMLGLMVAAGCEAVRATQIDYGACAGESTFPAVTDNLARVMLTGRQALLDAGEWTDAAIDDAIARFRRWSARKDAVIWYALPCAVARRPS